MYILFIKWPGEDKEDVEEYINRHSLDSRTNFLAGLPYDERPKWRTEEYQNGKHAKTLENFYANRRK